MKASASKSKKLLLESLEVAARHLDEALDPQPEMGEFDGGCVISLSPNRCEVEYEGKLYRIAFDVVIKNATVSDIEGEEEDIEEDEL